MKSLRYVKHPNGFEVKIYYSIEGHTWSQNLGKGYKDADGKKDIFGRNLQLIEEAVLQLFDGQEFIYNCNIKHERLLFEGIDTAHILPQTIHGMNTWKEYNNVACIAARNSDINYQLFLRTYIKLDYEEIQNIIGREFTYQSVLRGAIRDIENHDIKKVYVVDKGSALFLADQLKGAELIHLPIEGLRLPKRSGRPRMHKSDAARKAKERRQTLSGPLVDKANDERDTFRGWVFPSVFNNIGIDAVFSEHHEEFEAQLKAYADLTRSKKSDNCLTSPAFFDGRPRTKDNVVFANGIFIDMDGKDKPPIDPEALAALFPHVRMTIFNSYSSTLEWIRYRVWIPTDRVMSASEYYSTVNSIIDLLPKDAGIDMKKRHPVSIFYLPSQAGDVFGNYFKTFDDEGRLPLCVDHWVLPDYDETETSTTCLLIERNDEKVRKAIANWSPATAPNKKGHDYTFIFACQLKKAGLNKGEAEKVMLDEISKCNQNSRADRRNDVANIMKNQWDKLK